jgi:outer membrane biogenesis lipoprotein LolB
MTVRSRFMNQAAENVHQLPTEATLGDVVVQLRRIADVMEAQSDRCGERRGQAVCGLLTRHRGYHVTLDGLDMWLDE